MSILEPIREFLAKYKGREVTLEQVLAAIDRPRLPVLQMLDQLTAEGYLVETSDSAPVLGLSSPFRRDPTWEVNHEKDISKRPQVKIKPYNLRDKMWKAIRAKRRFTRGNLVVLTSCSRGSSESFTLHLERGKFIRRTGKEGIEILWLLIKDPGPKRPKIKEEKKALS